MAEASIAAGFAAALLDFAATKGADAQALRARSALGSDSLAQADARIPLASHIALLKAGAEACREPAFALQFGEAVRLEEVSIVGLIAVAAATMGEGRLQLNRFARLMIDAGDSVPDFLQLVRDDRGIWLELASPVFSLNPMLTESAFARFICGLKRGGLRPLPHAIHFTHDEPDYRAEYDRIFALPLRFGSDRNAVLIDEEFLAIELPPPNRYVFGVLSERADALLQSLEASHTLRAQVESVLIPVLHTGDVGMELVADKLHLSRATLYRRLKAEGIRYEQLLDELRHTMALHFLDAKRVSVHEAAYLVGFSDPSAFSRAFKRWTGLSPSEHIRR